jgi:hypothetical protein
VVKKTFFILIDFAVEGGRIHLTRNMNTFYVCIFHNADHAINSKNMFFIKKEKASLFYIDTNEIFVWVSNVYLNCFHEKLTFSQ